MVGEKDDAAGNGPHDHGRHDSCSAPHRAGGERTKDLYPRRLLVLPFAVHSSGQPRHGQVGPRLTGGRNGFRPAADARYAPNRPGALPGREPPLGRVALRPPLESARGRAGIDHAFVSMALSRRPRARSPGDGIHQEIRCESGRPCDEERARQERRRQRDSGRAAPELERSRRLACRFRRICGRRGCRHARLWAPADGRDDRGGCLPAEDRHVDRRLACLGAVAHERTAGSDGAAGAAGLARESDVREEVPGVPWRLRQRAGFRGRQELVEFQRRVPFSEPSTPQLHARSFQEPHDPFGRSPARRRYFSDDYPRRPEGADHARVGKPCRTAIFFPSRIGGISSIMSKRSRINSREPRFRPRSRFRCLRTPRPAWRPRTFWPKGERSSVSCNAGAATE